MTLADLASVAAIGGEAVNEANRFVVDLAGFEAAELTGLLADLALVSANNDESGNEAVNFVVDLC